MELVQWPILWQQEGSQIVPPTDEVITTDTDIVITTDDGHEIITG